MQSQNFRAHGFELARVDSVDQLGEQRFDVAGVIAIRGQGAGLCLFVHEHPLRCDFPTVRDQLLKMVRPRRLELPRPKGHNDLNVARLPIPPRPHIC